MANTIAKNAGIVSARIVDLTGLLKTNQIGNLPNLKYKYTSFTIKEFLTKSLVLEFDPNIQRMYLYNDIDNGIGDKWQRNLFKSYLIGEPVGTVELWYNPEKDHYEVLDAQQRLKTMKAILKDQIRTPKNTIIDGIDCSELHFTNLPDEIREKFVNFQFLVVASFITRDDAVERFIGINNGNPLSAQDKRSPQVSDFADFIRKTAFYPKPKYEFAEYDKNSGKLQLKHFSFSHIGRTMDEILAYLFMTIKDYQIRGVQSYSQKSLDDLYKLMKKDNSFFRQEDILVFEKILKNLDKLVKSDSWNRKINKKKELVYTLLLINHYTAQGGQISEPELFIQKFHSSISKCKKDKSLIFTDKKKNEDSDFATVYRLGTEKEYIEFILNNLLKEIGNSGIIYKDDKRAFSRSEIKDKFYEQDCKCAYCSTPIKLDDAIGDHMISHSRGGRTIYENLAVSCNDCNSMKSSLPWDGWVHAVKKMNGIDLSNLELNTDELVINQNV